MADKTLNTRILLKYDTYANWTTNNPVLKAGEVAIATIASGNTQEVNSVTAPQVLIKVGDGTSTYSALPFVSAKAADVYGWAKASTKPTYAANEITGIGEYIADYVSAEMGIEVDTDTQYTIVKVNDYQYKLQSRSKGDTAYADTGVVIDIPAYDDSDLDQRVEDLEALVGETAVADQIANAITALNLANTYEAKGEAAKVQTALNTYKNSNDAVIAAIKDGSTIDSFADVESALAGKQAVGDYATKAEAQGYANAKDAAITAAQNAADKAQGEVDALEIVVAGKADKATTLAGYGIGDAYTKTETEGVVNSAINEFAAKVSDDGTINTFKELIDYAAEHNSDFAEALGDIEANTQAIAVLNGNSSTAGSVDKKIKDAIAAQNLSQYAQGEDLDNLENTVSELNTYINDTVYPEVTSNAEEIGTLKVTVAKKANTADLAAIAFSGSTDDLVQGTNTLIFNCGDSNF